MAEAGYSINPSSTGAQGLDQYFDQQNKSSSGGFRAPIINIATGKSTLTPNLSADNGGKIWTYVLIVVAVLGGIYLWKNKIGD